MRRFIFFTALALTIALIPWFWGCSTNDDNPASPTDTLATGDDGVELMQDFLGNTVVDFSFTQALVALDLADNVLAGQGSPPRFHPFADKADGVTITINSSILDGNWFVMSITVVATESNNEGGTDSVYYTGTDSLRFSDINGYTTTPDSNSIMMIEARSHHILNAYSMGDSVIAANHNDFTFEMQPFDDILIGALTHDTTSLFVSDTNATCAVEVSNDQTWTDILVTPAVLDDDECPPSGSIGIAAHVAIDCSQNSGINSISINGDWTVTGVFDDGLITVTYTGPNSHFTAVDTCGTQGQTADFDSAYVEYFSDIVSDDMQSGQGNTLQASLEMLSYFDTTLHPFDPTTEPGIDPDGLDWVMNPSGWLVFTLDMADTSQEYIQTSSGPELHTVYMHVTGTDSIMVFNNDTFQTVPDANSDSLHVRMHYLFEITNTLSESFTIKADHNQRITGTPWKGMNYTASGNGTDTASAVIYRGVGGMSPCELGVTSTSVASNIVVNSLGITPDNAGCPTSGAFSVVSVVDFSCSTPGTMLDYDGVWSISTTFNGSTNTMTFGHGGQTVVVHWDCE